MWGAYHTHYRPVVAVGLLAESGVPNTHFSVPCRVVRSLFPLSRLGPSSKLDYPE